LLSKCSPLFLSFLSHLSNKSVIKKIRIFDSRKLYMHFHIHTLFSIKNIYHTDKDRIIGINKNSGLVNTSIIINFVTNYLYILLIMYIINYVYIFESK